MSSFLEILSTGVLSIDVLSWLLKIRDRPDTVDTGTWLIGKVF